MKKIKEIFILVILIFILLINCNTIFAAGEMQINSDKNPVESGEEIKISMQIKDTAIAALTLEIYWDRAGLEYISGPENSNNLNNRIIYTWVSSNGQDVEEINIDTFSFKSIQNGIANIAVTGEFYNSSGERVEINDNNLEIKIGTEGEETQQISKQNEYTSDDNTDLSILRLSEEGISPDFNKDIKEYYFVTDKAIDNIDITAISANAGATVTITGNTNLKMGENTIEIRVESKDKTKSSVYKIYVTKTNNLELANANLETLAVRQGTLEPEFDSNMTVYKVEIANNIDKIDILAIPQRENATVKVIGNGDIQVGDNKIEVVVLAENGTTSKKYEMIVHRRTEEEELINEEERVYQAERLSAILEEQENEDDIAQEDKSNAEKNIIISLILMVVIIIIAIIIIYKYNRKSLLYKNNNKNKHK